MLLIAGCLTPLIFLLEGILPSRENTRIDELPQIALFVGLVGLSLAGIARMAFALLVEKGRTQVAPSSREALSDGRDAMPPMSNTPQDSQLARIVTPVRNTPI
jgi:hypothetical protein